VNQADLQIFTADEPEVDALPRKEVVDFMERTHLPSCVAYLQHIIDDLKETGADFHDKLAELLLADATTTTAESKLFNTVSIYELTTRCQADISATPDLLILL
jgi:hypothetical protein